jgi:hypothetical protein
MQINLTLNTVKLKIIVFILRNVFKQDSTINDGNLDNRAKRFNSPSLNTKRKVLRSLFQSEKVNIYIF